ncbi:MAG TPA: hypothetical protein VJ603_06255 [Paucimonas sp.]|nr:hypothetical protein [Paucimonas sp.]
MAQPKMAKKSSRHHRNKQSEPSKDKPEPQLDADVPGAQANSEARESEANWLPMRLHASESNTSAQADRKPTPLALMPRQFPAMHDEAQQVAAPEVHEAKAKLSSRARALLIGCGVSAALILSFSALKTSRNEPHVALADPVVSLVSASQSSAGGHAVHDASSLEKGDAVTSTTHAGSRHAAASKSGTAASHAGKKSSHTHTEHIAHASADKAKKKSAPTIAKAPTKPHEDRSALLLAQNSATPTSKLPASQDRYAQCREIGNFFRREQCKWQVCNGKWGQDGCPSYASNNREVNY